MVIIVVSDILFWRANPTRRSKKGGAKGSVAMLKELTQTTCVSQDPHPKKSILRKTANWEAFIHRIQFSRNTWHNIKNRERIRSVVRYLSEVCALMSVVLVLQNLQNGHTKKPCNKNDAPEESRGNLALHLHKLKKFGQGYVLLSC